MKKQIIVRADNSFKRQVERLARSRGVTVNALVIAVLTRTLKNEKRRAA